jgi:hypothetical protein
VPAAAVIREGLALFEVTRRKGFVDGILSQILNIKSFFNTIFNTIILEFITEK